MSIELSSSISCVIKPGACVDIPTREHVALTDGYAAVLGLKRSYAKKGLSIGATIVENGYSGALGIQVMNHSNQIVEIYKGDKILNMVAFKEATNVINVAVKRR